MPRPTPIIVPGGLASQQSSGEVNISGLINTLAGIFGPNGLIQKSNELESNKEATAQLAKILGLSQSAEQGQGMSGVNQVIQKTTPMTPAESANFNQTQEQGMLEQPQPLTQEQKALLDKDKTNNALNYIVNNQVYKPGVDVNAVSGSPMFQEIIKKVTEDKAKTPKGAALHYDTSGTTLRAYDPTTGQIVDTGMPIYDKTKSPLIKGISGKDPMFEKGSPLRQKNHDPSTSYLIEFDPETKKPIANYGRSDQENRYLPYSPAPNMPPGWDINRKTGQWEFKGTPGGGTNTDLTGISAEWQAVKKSVQVANDSKARNMQASGSALFEGTKDKNGKVIIPATFDRLVQLRDELPDGMLGSLSNNLKKFNQFDQFVKWQTSDPKMAELKSTVIAAAERMGNIYSGGGSVTSDQKLKLAQELIDPTLNKDAFKALVQGHTKDLMNIVNTYGKTWTTVPGQSPKFLPQSTENNQNNTNGKPKMTW